MSAKNQAQNIKIVPLAPKEQEDFFNCCDKLYFSLLQKYTSPPLEQTIFSIQKNKDRKSVV